MRPEGQAAALLQLPLPRTKPKTRDDDLLGDQTYKQSTRTTPGKIVEQGVIFMLVPGRRGGVWTTPPRSQQTGRISDVNSPPNITRQSLGLFKHFHIPQS